MYPLELWFSQGICPVVGLLSHMVDLLLVFKEISRLFSLVAVSIYILTSSAREFIFSTSSPALIVCIFLIMAILTSVKLYLIVVLIYIFLIISNVEHFLMNLLAISMSSLE